MTKKIGIDRAIEYYRNHRPKGTIAMIEDCSRLEDKKYYQGKLAAYDEFVDFLETHRSELGIAIKLSLPINHVSGETKLYCLPYHNAHWMTKQEWTKWAKENKLIIEFDEDVTNES